MKITHTQVCTLLCAAADVLEEPARSELKDRDAALVAENASSEHRIESITDMLAEHYPLGAHEAEEFDDVDFSALNP